ncbi:MAG: lipoyl(octanoyl) transferase LipB [Methylophilaceae bacterium]
MQLITRKLGRTDYQKTLAAMQVFTSNRTSNTPDELWLTEHDSVYTLGLNRKNVRLPDNGIPVINVDRGGKITYHGPGQIIIYLLIDLGRQRLKVRQLVNMIEGSILELLTQYNITATTKQNAPGVYVNEKKAASVGLRLKSNCCYHGLSLNVDMDLSPFKAIDPCGYAGLEMTQTKDLRVNKTPEQIGEILLDILKNRITK